MATVYAARYDSNEPEASREWSSAGWGMGLGHPSSEAARSELLWGLGCCEMQCGACRQCERANEAFDAEYRVSQNAEGRFFVERFGLSAFVGEDEEEAIAEAQAGADRFEGLALWVFPARIVSEDEDQAVWGGNLARVLVAGPARQV